MKFRATLLLIGFVLVTVIAAAPRAVAAGAPQLVISQFKITSSGGQFVTLHNATDSVLSLSQYEVDYINSSGKLTNVPISGQLSAQGYYILNDDQQQLCYRAVVNSAPLGFATTGGTLQVWRISADKTTKHLQDSVTWTSKQAAGVVTLPAQNATSTVSLLRQPTNSVGNPQVSVPAGGAWQAVVPDTSNACTLNIVNTTTPAASALNNPGNQLGVGQVPPSTIVNLEANADPQAASPIMPPQDIGLNSPQITEILPNPSGTGTDASDEYIELYNPNAAPFHLVGFAFQTGATAKHDYKFPDGVILPPRSFTAFYSADTGLSLSNTSGQAVLLDPFGNALSETESYAAAKDGTAWALASDKWFWTTQATPGAANVIKQAATSKKSSATAGKVKGAATNNTGTGEASGAAAAPGHTTDVANSAGSQTPTHRYVLVVIGLLAVGYGIYEYRHDLGNRIHQLRENRATRRTHRQALARR